MTFLTNKTELELDENQKELIRKQGAKIPLTNLTRKVWPKEYASNKKLDGRSKYGIVIRSFMKSNEIEYTTSKVIPRDVRISEEQKDFIQKKLDVLTPHHIAKLLFPEIPHITPFSKEFQVVNRYVERLNLLRNKDVEIKNEFDYTPPKTIKEAADRVHKALSRKVFDDISRLKRNEVILLEKLVEYMSTTRLKMYMDVFTSDKDRHLFESTFIEHVWDKPDLTMEDTQIFLMVSLNYINQKNIQRAISILNEQLEQEGATRTLSEILSTKTNELNQCETRIKNALESLNSKRADRLKKLTSQVMNPLAFVRAFQDKQERANMIQIAKYQALLASEEADRLESVSEWKARIVGIDKSEVI